MTSDGVVVMAYGTARGLDDVERYYTDIRHGRPPSPEALAELTERYRAIGGSPLYETTVAQARGIEDRLGGVKVYLGQKHSPPFVADAIRHMHDDEVERAVGFVLAPHFSAMSIGDYERRARIAAEQIGWTGTFEMVTSWHVEPGFISWTARSLKEAIERLGVDEPLVVFSAHSLPERILQKKDPYPDQLRETAEVVAAEAGVSRWQIAWQSAGRTGEAWLGPDIVEVVEEAAAAGEPGLVLAPVGFVADHLEVLYDVDIEARQRADDLGLALERIAMPNDDPEFLDVLAGIVARGLARSA
ncbi:MAG: ferrochelatase [Actinobacteria bacterium]|nr:ferrochelatase [Actinomycetota bacterium]